MAESRPYFRQCKDTGNVTRVTEDYVRKLFADTFKHPELAMADINNGNPVNTMSAIYRFGPFIDDTDNVYI